MRRTEKRTRLKLVKTALAYVVCFFTPKAIVEAINEAASVDELDGAVAEAVGVTYADSDRISNA